MINKEFIKGRINEIKLNIEKIKKLTKVSEKEFFEDERNIYALKHLLLECIEAIAKICNHLLAHIGKKAPASYAECFEGLNELNIISSDLRKSLIKMARFRNILVHKYWEVDDRKVLSYGKKNLKDFERFIKEIGKFIEKKKI